MPESIALQPTASEQTQTKTIPVTVDKSHLITIGEKLYTEKMSFIRELVNNAYDADATEVFVEIAPGAITIRDNGTGMDEDGLRKYFTIGASEKTTATFSKQFQRKRIGEFGIGKFAALAASSKFEVETKRGDFYARLMFDKELWAMHEDWHINIDILPQDHRRMEGTTITLHNLTIALVPGKVRNYLRERTPITVPDFAVYLNHERVTDEIVAGKNIAIDCATPYGKIIGALVVAPIGRKLPQLGVGVTVKGVLVRYESFGLEISRKSGATRITGKVNADFLPITSSRDDFVRDSTEFQTFYQTMVKEVQRAFAVVREEMDNRSNLQASRVLKEALHCIAKAMRKHKELFPEARIPLGFATAPIDSQSKAGYEISKAEFIDTQTRLDPTLHQQLQEKKKDKRERGKMSGILGSKSIIRTLRIANMNIAVRVEHLGEDEESRVVGGVIYINIDHPLYRTYRNNDEFLTIHISRVITKELALQTGTSEPDRAFAIQSELLTEALKGKGL